VPLTLAREKAEAIRNQLARGIDPREDGKPARVITFKHCMDELLGSKEASWKNDKHRAQWHMTLKDYALPLHDLPVADIAVGDVKAALEPIADAEQNNYQSPNLSFRLADVRRGFILGQTNPRAITGFRNIRLWRSRRSACRLLWTAGTCPTAREEPW